MTEVFMFTFLMCMPAGYVSNKPLYGETVQHPCVEFTNQIDCMRAAESNGGVCFVQGNAQVRR